MESTTANFLQQIFSQRVSATYELVNHILTFGHDALWRRQTARVAAAEGGTQWADMCTGTGEMAICLSRLAPPETTVHAVDFSLSMMDVAKKKPEAQNIAFVVSGHRGDRIDVVRIAGKPDQITVE